ncbi:RidA family protein [Pikeienuella sp. HZG-20]|uniref:RidA family protein n=1 Tax=Paludibacillus litoralis TaxID=3133267 RepID=UPI0030EB2108
MTTTKQCYGGAPGLPLSAAVRAGDLIFVSGQMPLDDNNEVVSGNIETQTRATLERLKKTLNLAGAELSDVVKVTVWIADPRDFTGFNKVYSQYFSSDAPARSTVRSDLVYDVRLEIEAVAYKAS